MIAELISSVVTGLLISVASMLWRYRKELHLRFVVMRSSSARVRVSFAALLRVKNDDRFILFESRLRPGRYGPPGGVFKYHASAGQSLEHLHFQEQQIDSHKNDMRFDLRGYVPARSLTALNKWFKSGQGRETAAECLRRELLEELAELGFSELSATLAPRIDAVKFTHMYTVEESPRRVDGQPYHQMRCMEVHELAITNEFTTRLVDHLIGLSLDPKSRGVIGATHEEIMNGWCGRLFVSPHSAYLYGLRKPSSDQLPTE